VFTTIASGAIIEQVLARDGTLNTHATYLLATSKGDRLPITLPDNAELTAVLLNGNEVLVEAGTQANQRIVRLSHSAGQVSRFVLEVSYGVAAASASSLAAPALPKEIPVQQTLWRLWIPEDDCFLGYDRLFSRLEPYQGQRMLETLRRNQPIGVEFKLSGQGKQLNFVRQGAPGELSVLLVGKEIFSIVIWVLIIAAGVLMLKLSGFNRVLIILAAGVVAGIIHLYLPLLVDKVIQTGVFAAILVLLLWAAQWAFRTLPQLRRRLGAERQAASQNDTKTKKQQSNAKATQKPQAPDEK
jgi:hypothetical protein